MSLVFMTGIPETSSVARFGPLQEVGQRPFCTVALPTYNVIKPYFEATLRSVLDQDPGADQLEIFVSDDGSTNGIAESVVRRLAPGRIRYFRNPSNLGLAGNWNACVERARGRWVHILHQDDLARSGFYMRMASAFQASPEIGVFLCRHTIIDSQGQELQISPLERADPGLLDDWLPRISRNQHVQCPAIAVRRDVYERLGGFRSDLRFVVDWEMWVRLTAAGVPWWYESEVLASFRVHENSESARLDRAGQDLDDVRRGVRMVQPSLPPHLRRDAGRGLIELMGTKALIRAQNAIRDRSPRLALRLLHQAVRLNPSLGLNVLLAHYRWLIKEIMSGVRSAPG